MIAECITNMYHTLKTGEFTSCSVYLRLPGIQEPLLRHLQFQPAGRDLIMLVFPEIIKTETQRQLTLNFFSINVQGLITGVMQDNQNHLIGLPASDLFPIPEESDSAKLIMAEAILFGKGYSWNSEPTPIFKPRSGVFKVETTSTWFVI